MAEQAPQPQLELPILRDNVAALVLYLRSLQFLVGVEKASAAHQLLATLIANGQTTMDATRLCRLLGPVLCNSPQQQRNFPRYLQQFYQQTKRRYSTADSLRRRVAKRQKSVVFAEEVAVWTFTVVLLLSLPLLLWQLVFVHRIYGTVVDHRSQALSGVAIRIGEYQSTSDDSGKYSLVLYTSDHRGQLVARHPSYPEYRQNIALRNYAISLGEIRLVPHQYPGKAVDQHGEPVIRASIQIGEASAISDQHGQFTIGYVGEQQHAIVRIDHPECLLFEEQLALAKLTLIQLTRLPTLQLRGHLAATGTSAKVTLSYDQQRQNHASKDGHFTFSYRTRAETGTLAIDHPDYQLWQQQVSLATTRDLGEIPLEPLMQHKIFGRCVDEQKNTIANVAVQIAQFTVRSDAEGKFTIAGVRSRENQLLLRATHDNYAPHERSVPLDKDKIDLGDIVLSQDQVSLYSLLSYFHQLVPASLVKKLSIHPYLWATAIAAITLALLLLLYHLRYHRLRLLTVQRSASREPLEIELPQLPMPLTIEFPPLQNLRLRRHEFSPQLDCFATAHATAARAGVFTPIQAERRVPPEYLVLIDQASEQDHHAQWASTLVAHMRANGIAVQSFYFHKDPLRCFDPASNTSLALTELSYRYPQHRLVLFSDGDGLCDPFGGELHSWTIQLRNWDVRILFTPAATSNWGHQEWLLANEGLLLLPINKTGLASFAQLTGGNTIHSRDLVAWSPQLPAYIDENSQRWLSNREPDADVAKLLKDLRQYLGDDGYYWLQACAMHPQIHWRITFHLGHHLHRANGQCLFAEQELLRLIRLPWFRHGKIPEWLRLQLIDGLSPQQRQQISHLLQQLGGVSPALLCAEDLRRPLEFARRLRQGKDALSRHLYRQLSWRTRWSLWWQAQTPIRKISAALALLALITLGYFALQTPPPDGWPADLWQQCWHAEQEYVDFTGNAWLRLAHEQQVQYARAYQHWYAKYKNLAVSKEVPAAKSNIEVMLIPPGKFWMGSPEDEKDREGSEKRHAVLLSKHYYIGKYEVTQQQWQAVMGDNPAYFKGERNPVEQVDWNRCVEFCDKLGGQLPTEAQWEYACRAGTTRPFNLGDDIDAERVNYDGNFPYRGNKGVSRGKTVAVGSLANENSWGCYDFHGNLWEWCRDWYKFGYTIGVANPIGPNTGSNRVLRGGSWNYYAKYLRSAYRDNYSPPNRHYNVGFRFCKSD